MYYRYLVHLKLITIEIISKEMDKNEYKNLDIYICLFKFNPTFTLKVRITIDGYFAIYNS